MLPQAAVISGCASPPCAIGGVPAPEVHYSFNQPVTPVEPHPLTLTAVTISTVAPACVLQSPGGSRSYLADGLHHRIWQVQKAADALAQSQKAGDKEAENRKAIESVGMLDVFCHACLRISGSGGCWRMAFVFRCVCARAHACC